MSVQASWDIARAVALFTRGASYAEIGSVMGVSKQAIHHRIRGIVPDVARVSAARQYRADMLAEVTSDILSSIDEKAIKSAGLKDRAMTYGILYDKERLERGESTQNVQQVAGKAKVDKVEDEIIELQRQLSEIDGSEVYTVSK